MKEKQLRPRRKIDIVAGNDCINKYFNVLGPK